jgi:hypothetical protein
MVNPHSRRLFLIGATVLTTSAPVLADNSSEKAPEVSTVIIGPQGPTPAELVKLEAATAAQAVAPAPEQNAAPIMHPVLAKPAEITTIVIGPSGLTPQELAKVTAQVAPAPVQTPPISTTPASTTTPAPAEK